MKIYNINPLNLSFKGKREDRKTVAQLKENNPYSLNRINQRRINNAIDSLAEVSGENNAEYLLDVAENLKYHTNIDLGKSQFNDWQVKLGDAIQKSLAKSSIEVQEKLTPRLNKLQEAKPLSDDEKEMLKLRKSILSQIDTKQLENIESKNIKNLGRNLDYFIVSSEVTTAQKLYILKRLDHFISPEYKINPQLEDKKTQALAEIINDITVDTPESNIPNIKSVNQQSHGMCAAISICRKALAYEDKVNYVDIIMSELDANPYMMVYDISNLGSGTKVPIGKTRLDFNYALSKGYRIIDTSALYWMSIANTAGASNEFVGMYCTFDKDDFDTFHDSHLMPNLETKELEQKQDYYRALLKAKEAIGNYKSQAEMLKSGNLNSSKFNPELAGKLNVIMTNLLSEISPTTDKDTLRKVFMDLLSLEVTSSTKASKVNNYTQDFVYLPNESENAKIEKIKAFLSIALPDKISEKLDKNAQEILNLTESINELISNNSNSYQARVYSKALGLYNAAATFRTHYSYGLAIPEVLEELTIDLKIPDRETRISKNIDMLIKNLEQGNLSPKIKEELAQNLETENNSEVLIETLKEYKDSLDYQLTTVMDDLYNSIELGSRKDALIRDITVLKHAIKSGETYVQTSIAANMDIEDSKYKVLNVLDKYGKILERKDCTNEQYIKIFNSIGKKSLMYDFKDKFEEFCSVLNEQPPREDLIEKFKEIHNLPEDATPETFGEILVNIGDKFNEVAGITTFLQQVLEARNDDGTVLNTVDAKPIIMKKLENAGMVIPEKDLRALQERFAKISKARTNVNGEELELKDLPKELFVFSKHEKDILKQIENNINAWNSSITRSLKIQYQELKDPLNELHREVGVKKGEEYVSEGSSGLTSTQQVRIFEYMTDRPYYTEDNGNIAINKMKNSPYSGITSTSVNHKQPAWHAQYVADIRPVTVKTDNGKESKEALFHDNSWGPTEHANTWVDETGLTRTDYEREFGGQLGYITDDKYLNGKLIENLEGEIGRVKYGISDEYRYAMHNDTIIAGKSPLANSQVKRLRDTILINPLRDFEYFENLAASKTYIEMLDVINKTKHIGSNAVEEYMDIHRRIFGNNMLNPGIQTKEEYDKLSDDDQLKVLFEKIALLKSYNQIPDEKIFFKHSTMEDLRRNKESIRQVARKNFDYVFAKNPEFIKYGIESIRLDATKLLKEFANENNIKLEEKQIISLINSLKGIDKSKFDGSLNNTIELMGESFTKALIVNLPNFDDKNDKIEDLANQVQNMLRTKLEFTLADLNESSSAKGHLPKNIIKWIDKVIEPRSDEEFVQIFNELQNMTSEEFNQKYGNKIDNEALNISSITGYDVLKQYLAMDSKTEDMLFSMLYYQDYEYNVEMSETEPIYDFNKFGKILRGSFYKKNRTFDDLYLDYYYSLMLLTLPSRRYKPVQQQLFEKQGVFFAYPQTDFDEEKEVETLVNEFSSKIAESMDNIENGKIQSATLKNISNVYKYILKKSPDAVPTKSERIRINKKIQDFLNDYNQDEDISKVIQAAQSILAQDTTVSYQTYQNLITVVYEELNKYAKSFDGKSINDFIKKEIKGIETFKTQFVMGMFPPQYQGKAYELVNKYIRACAKQKENAPEILYELEMLLRKHRFVKKPEQMLNEYLLLLAKPDGNDNRRELSQLEKDQLNEVKEIYQTTIQNNLFASNFLDLQYIIMDCAKEGNLNIVKDELKNSQIKLSDGSYVTINSDAGMSIVVAALLEGMDLKDVKTFIEQLGLSERVVEVYSKMNMKKLYSLVKRLHSIFSSVNSQLKFIRKETEKLGNIDDVPNYEEKLEVLKQNIKHKIHNTNYRKTGKIVDSAFTDLLNKIKEDPQISKTDLLNIYLNGLKQAMIMVSSADVNEIISAQKDYQLYISLVQQLQLPPNSPAIGLREEFLGKIKELEEFTKQQHRRYPELNITTYIAQE